MIKNTTIFILFIALISCTSEKQIMKHPLDNSESRTLVLDNGLKVYLLSDPNFNVSAASISVEVGSFQDPEDREGLAHFLEHMLFLGTEKYPDVDEYSSYLKNNGGFSNAYTSRDLTNYQFQVLPDAFDGALDRFAQFFIGPLFTEEYTAREVNAVHSEYDKNIMSDGWRQFRMGGQFAKDGHPAKKFNIGSLETLGDIKREELITFYNNHYSANRMGLSMLSTHSLDQMEEWAKKHFSSIENRNLSRNEHDPNVYEHKETVRIIKIKPVKDIRQMSIVFDIPSTRDMYETKPGRQFASILGHEGRGSLLSYLKKEGWALSLGAYTTQETKEIGYANVTIGLTEEGLKEYKKVLKSVVGYINLMKQSGFQKHVFQELKSMASLNEIYSSKGEGMGRAINLANDAMMYPLEDVGRINYIYRDGGSDSYNKLLSDLSISKMIVMLSAKELTTDQEEHFFKVNYSYHEDKDLYKELETAPINQDFAIAEKNPFIPSKATIPNRKIDDTILPKRLDSDQGSSLYFGQDHEFLRPKGVISLKIMFPKDKMSVEHRVLTRLYSACVNESMNELSYPARLAGLNYSVREGYEGIFVDIDGYKESAMSLYELILDHMLEFSITENQFDAIKDKVVRDYENFSLSDAYMQTRELAPDLFYETKYSWKEALPVAKGLSLNAVQEYSRSLYKETFLEALVYGDFAEKDGKKVVDLFNQKTSTTPIQKEEAFEIKYLSQDKPETIQYVQKLLVNNSCFFRKYEAGKDSPETRAILTLMSKAIEQPFYTEMRTNQQLGYIVWSYPRGYDDTYYLNFLIQSGGYSANELANRANSFILETPSFIRDLDDATFQGLIESSIEQLEKKPMSISERARKHRALIFDRGADFFRDQKTIGALKLCKKEEVADYLERTIAKETRKMVDILAFAENHTIGSETKSSFNDLKDWKSTKIYD